MLEGLKENVIVGHLIPAGTGIRKYNNLVVGSREEYERLTASGHHDDELVEKEDEGFNG